VEENSLIQAADSNSPVALVTGSTSGIGAAIARRLSSEGYAVLLHSRSSAEVGRALAAELGKATYIQADLADDADRIRLVREAVSWRGRLDVLVNNAGISRVIPHADLTGCGKTPFP
jgi:NAD(P)-dependent dehydrogenase (short-subunit alcohol dehydrogenase family)